MHILEVTYDYPPNTMYGMGIHVGELAPALTQQGQKVTVVTRNNGMSPADTLEHESLRVVRCEEGWDRQYLQSMEVAREVRSIQRQMDLCDELYRIIREKGIRCDVVHNHSYATVPLACELSDYWGVPMISTIHVLDVANERTNVPRPRWLGRHALRGLEAEGLKRSSLIIAPSDTIRQWLIDEYVFCTGRVTVLPHPNAEAIPIKHSYAASKPFRVLYVGRLLEYKGVKFLFDALSRLPGGLTECWVVGDGRLRHNLEEQARAEGLSVKWLGQLSRPEVLRLYREADVLVVPSLVETFGLVLQEGLQAGIPVIASTLDVFAERVTDGVNGCLVPILMGEHGAYLDVPALAQALARLMHDAELRRRVGETAVKLACRVGDYSHYAAKVVSLLNMRSEGRRHDVQATASGDGVTGGR